MLFFFLKVQPDIGIFPFYLRDVIFLRKTKIDQDYGDGFHFEVFKVFESFSNTFFSCFL